MLELMDSKLEFIHKRIHLRSVLIVYLRNINPALMQKRPLVSFCSCIALAMAGFAGEAASFLCFFYFFHLFCHLLIKSLAPYLPLAYFSLQPVIELCYLLL